MESSSPPGADDARPAADPWAVALDTAWRRFRVALADHLADGGGGRLAALAPHPTDQPAGVVLTRAPRGRVVAELMGHPAAPAPPGRFPMTRPLHDADRVALDVADTLRTCFGVAHPGLLDPDGMPAVLGGPAARDVVDLVREAEATRRDAEHHWPEAVRVRDADHLHELVLDAVGGEGMVDDDGDLVLPVGDRDVVFVRVHRDRPLVELFAHLTIDLERPERVPDELDILNRRHPDSTFVREGDDVLVRRTLPAAYFVAAQLRASLGSLCGEVAALGDDLRRRVGGEPFLARVDPEGADPARDPAVPSPAHTDCGLHDRGSAGLAQLLELLPAGPVPPAVVAELFEHDRVALVHVLVAYRRDGVDGVVGDVGGVDGEVHDQAIVLAHLRAGLRHVAEVAATARASGQPPPRRLRTQQLPLLDAVEGDLLGLDGLDDLGDPAVPGETGVGPLEEGGR